MGEFRRDALIQRFHPNFKFDKDVIDLWEFQQDDVAKLRNLPGALITNEMGTGKTREALALDHCHRVAKRPKWSGRMCTLVVAPGATHTVTWLKHFNELLPDLRVVLVDPKDRDGSWQRFLKAGDVFVVHWEALRLMPQLQKVVWVHIIADEVQKAKNRKAQQTQALKKLKCAYKTGLSGTPVTNKPQDYFSVLQWLYPEHWRSYWRFFDTYVDHEVKVIYSKNPKVPPRTVKVIKGPKNVDTLLTTVQQYTVRHLKKEPCCAHHPKGVLPYLPEKYYDTIPIDLLPVQRRAYDEMDKEMVAWVGANRDKPVIAPVVIARMIRLQQFAVAYAEVGPEGKVLLSEPSAKLDALMDMIEDNETKQFVVFTQFSQLVDLLGKRLKKEGITCGLYTGNTPKPERTRIVQDFQANKLRVFAGTIKAGGVGLDLYSASTVCFLDRDWSPAENKQAEDRLHRAGQKNAVQVVDFIARSTVDLGRHQEIQLKWEWIRTMLGDKIR